MGFTSFIHSPAAVYPPETSAQHPSSCAALAWHLCPLLRPRAAGSQRAFCGARAVQSILAYQASQNKPNKIILELSARFRPAKLHLLAAGPPQPRVGSFGSLEGLVSPMLDRGSSELRRRREGTIGDPHARHTHLALPLQHCRHSCLASCVLGTRWWMCWAVLQTPLLLPILEV